MTFYSPGFMLIIAYILLLKVRDYLQYNSKLKSKSDSVTVLDGTQEGAYQWVCLLNFKIWAIE